ncbi:MAG: 2-oxo acid dehydrogenase subunit E2, partial [Myxococcota bacterium]
MNLCEVRIPQINVNDPTATILEWHVKARGQVRKGAPLLTVETSKAATEIEAPADGFVQILAAAGTEVEVGATVALIAPTPEGLRDAAPEAAKDEAVRATERARRLALRHGIDLAALKVRGIITERHVRDLMAESPDPPPGAGQDAPALPAAARVSAQSRVQRAVARTVMSARETHAPAHLLAEADWRQAQARLEEMSEAKGTFVSPVDLIIFHAARSLREFPRCNATLTPAGLHEFAAVNIGATVDVQDDLYVIVVRDADQLSLSEIAEKRHAHQMQLFRGHPDAASLEGGTFTVTLLEHPGLTWQIPIVFPNQAAILGTGGIQERLWLDEEGKPAMRPVLGLSLSYDHRFVNGA